VFSPLEPTDEGVGFMVETAIFSQWLHRHFNIPCYARWNSGEVDMVVVHPKNGKPKWAIEIKWTNKPFNHIEELKTLISFCEKHNITDSFVTTLDKWGVKKYKDVSINFVPSAVYAYNVGYNTIKLNMQKLIGS
jgi:hypothetical protein